MFWIHLIIVQQALESEFERNKYLSVSKRMQLSKQLKLTETQVCGF